MVKIGRLYVCVYKVLTQFTPSIYKAYTLTSIFVAFIRLYLFKKLDILVVRSFIGPFVGTLFIAIFILTLQFFWLYIDDMVGKGLNFITLLKLIGFVFLHVLPLALPIAMLLSSIITFGNLGETFEIVAIKAAGISLLRFMRPLFIVTIGITITAFIFLNYFIPYAELKLETLKHDIILKQPSFDIKEGVFYNKLNGYVIRVGKKEQDSIIKNVVIFEKNNQLQDNFITAESGIMRVQKNSNYLTFVLKNGWRYQEKGTRGMPETDFVRMGFTEYTKLLDLSSLNMNKTNEDVFEQNAKMLSVRQIDKALDSIVKKNSNYKERSKIELKPYFAYLQYEDSVWKKEPKTTAKQLGLNDSLKKIVYARVIDIFTSAKNNFSGLHSDYQLKAQNQRTYKIEWQKRFTFSFACIVLFLIGAPLGSIIRKGGLGTPLVFAIAFFAVFHLLNTFGERLSNSGVTSTFVGMWLSALVLLPIGFFLIFKAMRDSQLFNNEFYFRLFKQLKQHIADRKEKKNSSTI